PGFCLENPSPFAYDFWDLWFAAANDGWAVGTDTFPDYSIDPRSSAAIFHFDGREWKRSWYSTERSVTAIWGSGPNDVWAGGPFLLLHWDGAVWSEVMGLPKFVGISRLWGSGPRDVWAVGADGFALHYDGKAWSQVMTGQRHALHGLCGGGPGDAWSTTRD